MDEEEKWKGACQAALSGFKFGDIELNRDHFKSRDGEFEILSIEIDGKPVWERHFEGKLIPEVMEKKFYKLGRQLEELSRKANVEVVTNAVKRIAASWGYQVSRSPPTKSEGRQAYIYYDDEYYRDFLCVDFIDSGRVVAYWWSPLWYRDSNIWRDRFNTSRNYWGWCYGKWSPQKVEEEIEQKLRIA